MTASSSKASPSPASRAWPSPRTRKWPEGDLALLTELKPEALPRHVAVIMDGNGRWAKGKGFMERVRGHEAGVDSVREITRTGAMLYLEALTLYAFSSENWVRPRAEVAALMKLLERFLVQERPELMDNGIRLMTVGDTARLPDGVRRRLDETMELTRGNDGLRLVLALSYGSRDEMLRAVRSLARDARDGRLDPDSIDGEAFAARLDTAGLPDPDLLIRTSGEMRVSNFLLWQIAYSELYVTPVLWPDFRRADFLRALIEFQGRERRFGDVESPGGRKTKSNAEERDA